MSEESNNDYRVWVHVENEDAMPEDLRLALQAVAERIAADQGEGEVQGFGSIKLDIEMGRTSGPIVMRQPSSWCIGYSDNDGGEDWTEGGKGSCWINWP